MSCHKNDADHVETHFVHREMTMGIDMWIEKIAAKLMTMDDETWQRHANPWSGWSRITILPLIALAIWSRVWIGWWALLPIAICLLWTWLNARLFRKPDRVDNWMSEGVYGERIWLSRKTHPVPEHHRIVPHLLSICCGVAGVIFAFGLFQLDVMTTVFGMVMLLTCKLWFMDRMVWLRSDTISKPE